MYRSTAEIIGEKISVVNRPSVKLSLSADDWALYDDYDDTGRYANRENVAVALNDYISDAINTSDDKAHALKRCMSILDKYSDSGANDTEGREVLSMIFTAAFGK
jgi:hypothetical protein